MKKILLLGGSAQQVVAIETARRLGIYTVLCDYLPDNPGQYVADQFYLVSTTDKDAILKVAQEEMVDGVLAYASDPAAPTAAYVAEKMGLASNPYESVETLCNKDRFRSFLQSNGFNSPQSGGYDNKDEAMGDIENFRFPVIVKPVDSSGSKGVTVLEDTEKAGEAIDLAFEFSRGHRIIIEEYIEKKHPYLIGGDIFVSNGKVVLWGLMNCHRDSQVNELVPVGKSYPLMLEEADIRSVKEMLQRLVDKLEIKFGAMNVELVVDKNDRVWPIDIGPRNGGNMIPDLLGYIFEVDVVELSVRYAMGWNAEVDEVKGTPFYATHNLHTSHSGIFERIDFSDYLEEYIIRKNIFKVPGDEIEYFDNASKALGIIFMKFNNMEEMTNVLAHINEHIHIIER